MSEKLLQKRKQNQNRLRTYDYSKNNAYFITACSINRLKIFSVITRSETTTGDQWSPLQEPQLTDIGKIINEKINLIPQIYNNVSIENFVIMPNHVHLIILIDNVGATIADIVYTDYLNFFLIGRLYLLVARYRPQYLKLFNNGKVPLQNKSVIRFGKNHFTTVSSIMKLNTGKLQNILKIIL